MDDEAIVALFLQRDEGALREVSGKYGGRLRTLANSILQDASAAEECENDTYLQAWNSIPPHQPGGYLFAFLAKITRHLALDACRRRARKKRAGICARLTKELEQCIPGPSDTPCQVDGILLAGVLESYLQDLPEEKRYMFLRRYWYCDSVPSVAKRMGITQAKVKTTLHRVRAGLKEYLTKEGYDV